MSRSKPNKPALPPDPEGNDEVEILEIVGVDDPAPLASAERATDADGPEAGHLAGLDKPADRDAGDATLGDGARLVRLRADFENFKKRVERENEGMRRQAAARLVKELLPILDNFERAVAVTPRTAEESSFHSGFVLIFRQLLDALRAEGLSAIDSLGQPFDPNLHDAVATDPDSGLPSNTIVEELQRGYLLHHRLLRPALVKVSVSSQGNEPSDTGGGA